MQSIEINALESQDSNIMFTIALDILFINIDIRFIPEYEKFQNIFVTYVPCSPWHCCVEQFQVIFQDYMCFLLVINDCILHCVHWLLYFYIIWTWSTLQDHYAYWSNFCWLLHEFIHWWVGVHTMGKYATLCFLLCDNLINFCVILQIYLGVFVRVLLTGIEIWGCKLDSSIIKNISRVSGYR